MTNPRRIVTNPVIPVRRIATMQAVPVDRSNKALSKNEKGYQENQENICHHENENTGNGGGRLQYHQLRQ